MQTRCESRCQTEACRFGLGASLAEFAACHLEHPECSPMLEVVGSASISCGRIRHEGDTSDQTYTFELLLQHRLGFVHWIKRAS